MTQSTFEQDKSAVKAAALARLPDGAWEVTLETRRVGAIGVFRPKNFTVRAAGRAEAIKFALDSAQMEGFDCRFALKQEFISSWKDYLSSKQGNAP